MAEEKLGWQAVSRGHADRCFVAGVQMSVRDPFGPTVAVLRGPESSQTMGALTPPTTPHDVTCHLATFRG